MIPPSRNDALDRHALAVSIWVTFGFLTVTLFSHGFGSGGLPFVFAGAGAIAAGFFGHVIVNAVYKTAFSPGELALGLVIYVTCLVAFGVATLLDRDFGARNFLAVSVDFIAIGVIVVGYMILHYGVRRTFQAFNVISDFGADDSGPGSGA